MPGLTCLVSAMISPVFDEGPLCSTSGKDGIQTPVPSFAPSEIPAGNGFYSFVLSIQY